MTTKYRAVPSGEVIASLPPERQARIKARAVALIAEEMALRDLRRARRVTQEQVAERLGGRQVYVSRFEKRADMKLSTLRDYVRAIGGDLQLMVTFPEGETVRIKEIGEGEPPRSRPRAEEPKREAKEAAKRSAKTAAAAARIRSVT
ncbi:MAG TPA: helix-turn-helix domain-containing protein [Roseiarcus sp.]|nr:helix-turn-helix domain-containing protein [Roseiarcus sp.]